jgi:hypothetical protein
MTKKKRDALADEIRCEVPLPALAATIGFIIQARRERAGMDPEFSITGDVGQVVDEFMKTATIRQLKLLRQMALDLEEEKPSLH